MSYQQNIKVSEALNKGKSWINTPAITLFCFFLFVCLPVALYVFRENPNGVGIIISGLGSIILGILLPILWYAINIVKYKIWVGKNVKDIHRFHTEAHTKNLINESKFFKIIEIKTQHQKKELHQFYYNRLDGERQLVTDINSEILPVTVFKDNRLVSIVVFIILIFGAIYLKSTGEFNDNATYAIIGVCILLSGIEIYKQTKYKFILKIDNQNIAYKDSKEVIPWRVVNDFRVIFGSRNRVSELVLYTSDKEYKLKLDSFSRMKLQRLINVLNENKHRYDVKSHVK